MVGYSIVPSMGAAKGGGLRAAHTRVFAPTRRRFAVTERRDATPTPTCADIGLNDAWECGGNLLP